MKNSEEQQLLYECQEPNYVKNVKALLSQKVSFSIAGQDGTCALHYAAKFSDESMIDFLIGQGISANVMDNDNRTPLLWACQKANNV